MISVKICISWIYYNFILPILIGLISGVIGGSFFYAIKISSFYRLNNYNVIYFLPIFGIFIVFLYKKSKIDLFYGNKDILYSIKNNFKINPLLFLCVYFSTIFSHLSGASIGKESASIQLGASLGEIFCNIFKVKNKKLLIITFMSGMMTAVFTFPMTALFFVLEMFEVKEAFQFFIPCLISAITSNLFIKFIGIEFNNGFKLEYINIFLVEKNIFIKIILLSILACALAIIVSFLLKITKQCLNRYLKNDFLIILVGGILIIVLTFSLKTFDYNGLGTSIIGRCFQENFSLRVFLLKILFTVISVSAGYKGGDVIPIIFIGATFGNAMSDILGLDKSVASLVGILSIFSVFCKKFFATIFLGLEMLGMENFLIYFLIVSITFIFNKISDIKKLKIF